MFTSVTAGWFGSIVGTLIAAIILIAAALAKNRERLARLEDWVRLHEIHEKDENKES